MRPLRRRHSKGHIMSKERNSVKAVKKQPASTPKEKKAAKQAKKNASELMQPLVKPQH